MDDLLLLAESYQLAKSQAATIKQCLTQLGFIISHKSMQVPSTTAQFLGLMVNSCPMTVALPEEKVAGLSQLATNLLSNIYWFITFQFNL